MVLFFGTLSLFLKSWFATRPSNLGVNNGRLAACGTTPNCVSSQAYNTNRHMPPIQYTSSVEQASATLCKIIEDMPRTKLVSVSDDYIHAEFTSRIFKFVDDVEFYIDEPNMLIHFRSASRMGYSDYGANRERMLQIINQFERHSTAESAADSAAVQ